MDSLIYLGRTFHNLGAANRKTRSPRVALGLTFGKLSKVLSLELLKLYLQGVSKVRSDCKLYFAKGIQCFFRQM